MTPIPPRPDSSGTEETRTIEDEIESYEVDGWNVGFAVQFNGVGRIAEAGESNSGDDSDFPATDPETDDEQTYAGYQRFPVEVISGSDDEIDAEPSNATDPNFIKEQETRSNTASAELNSCALLDLNNISPDPMVLEKVKKMADQLPKPKENCRIAHQPVDIVLDPGKMDAIKNAMTGFHLAPPRTWSDVPNDEQIRTLVESLSSR